MGPWKGVNPCPLEKDLPTTPPVWHAKGVPPSGERGGISQRHGTSGFHKLGLLDGLADLVHLHVAFADHGEGQQALGKDQTSTTDRLGAKIKFSSWAIVMAEN